MLLPIYFTTIRPASPLVLSMLGSLCVEDACHHLDLTAELQGAEAGVSYERYSTALRQQTAYKDEAHSIKSQLRVLEQSATYAMIANPNIALLPVFSQLTSEITTRKQKLQHLVSDMTILIKAYLTHVSLQEAEIANLESVLNKGFHKEEGALSLHLRKHLHRSMFNDKPITLGLSWETMSTEL